MTRHCAVWMIAFVSCLAIGSARGQSLIPDTNPVSLDTDAGTTTPQIQTVGVTTASGTLTFTATASTTSGGNWLTVCLTPTCPANSTSVSTDTDNGQLTIQADPTGLEAGTYTGAITLACVPAAACAQVIINVSFQLNGVIETATPNPVPISVVSGQSTPAAANVTLGGNGNVSVTVTAGAAWLSASLSNPEPASTLTLIVNAGALPTGPYVGSVLIQCVSGSPCLSKTVSVSLTVAPPALMAAPTVPLSGLGRGTPVSATVFVSSSSGGALNFTSTPSTTSGGSWLSVSISPTTTPQTLTIQANPASLDVGSYTGTITLACASSTPCTGTTITVNLTVQPGITVSPSPLTLTATHSEQSIGSTLTITSLVTGGLPFTIACPTTAGGPWLICAGTGAATTSGTSFQVVAASAEMVGNTAYHGTVSITGGGTTINVPVTFQLQGTQLTLNPPTVNFTVPLGQVSAAQSVSVGPAGFTATAGPNSPFVAVSPHGSFSTGTSIQVLFDATHFAGTPNYTSAVTVTCGVDNCFDAALTVHATVTTPPTLSVTPSTLSTFSVVHGSMSASQTVNVTSSDGSSLPFTVSATGGVTLGAAGGTASGTATPVSISVDAHSLPAGQQFTGSVTFACNPVASCPSITLPVTANVTSNASLISSQSSVTFAAYTGRSAASKNITMTASDGSALPFTLSGVPSWLTVSGAGGTTGQPSGTLTLTLNPNPPASSQPPGSLTLTPTGSSASPLVIPVTLTVSPFTISASPSPLPISVMSGQISQPASLAITTIDGASAQVNVSATGSPILPTLSSASVTAPGNITVTANATNVPANTYNATVTVTCAAANPCAAVQVPVQIMVTSGPQTPVITPSGVVPIYSSSTTIQPGSWISIYGSNFADGVTVWAGNFPTTLGETSVTIDDKPAYINFVAPNQINVQAPDDMKTGTVSVVVTTSTGATASSTVNLEAFGPSFCLVGSSRYIAGIVIRNDGSGLQGGGTYDFIGPNGTSLGFPTRPVKAGDVVELYGVGFGPVNPPIPAGQLVPAGTYGTALASSNIAFVIGGISVKPDFAGITEAGLFQFNLTIPAGVGSGDVAIAATAGGLQTPANILIAAQ
jgi:uncharacterized protein (TIGR03437 family)